MVYVVARQWRTGMRGIIVSLTWLAFKHWITFNASMTCWGRQEGRLACKTCYSYPILYASHKPTPSDLCENCSLGTNYTHPNPCTHFHLHRSPSSVASSPMQQDFILSPPVPTKICMCSHFNRACVAISWQFTGSFGSKLNIVCWQRWSCIINFKWSFILSVFLQDCSHPVGNATSLSSSHGNLTTSSSVLQFSQIPHDCHHPHPYAGF